MKATTKGRKARTLTISTGETFRVYGEQRGVCVINDPVAGRYHYTYSTGAEAIAAAEEMNRRAVASGVAGFSAAGYEGQ